MEILFGFDVLRLIIGTDKGVPLGNITSQIFANVYLNKLDNFVEDELKLKRYYVRYNDDFIIVGNNRQELFDSVKKIREFLKERLLLELPNDKIVFRKLNWGIDFCGYVVLNNGILLRNKTKKRMFQAINIAKNKLNADKISQSDFRKIMDSYFGLLSHCKAYNLKSKIKSIYLCENL